MRHGDDRYPRLRHRLRYAAGPPGSRAGGVGHRLQESVFQLRLEPAELDEVRRQVTEIINQVDDVIHLYPLCDSCLARSEVHGTAPALDDAGLYRGVW